MPYLLDTSTCIAAMRNQTGVLKRMADLAPADCVVSTITSYELHTGIAKCAAPARESAKVEVLLQAVVELPFGGRAAREAARIRALLEAQGNMIGPYDVLLAAQALAAELTLVTGNFQEFCRVPDLVLEDWQQH